VSKHCYNVNVIGSGITVTFKPGTYYAITVGAFAPTLVFTAGLYNIVGSINNAAQCIVTNPCSLSLTGIGANICGGPVSAACPGGTGGVTFYFGAAAASVQVNGIGNSISLTAQTTGTYAGILFYQNRSNSTAACFGGCSGSVTGILNFLRLEGALYFPAATVGFTGCCQNSPGNYQTAYEIIVANRLTFEFDYFNDNYSSLPGNSPVRRTLLVE